MSIEESTISSVLSESDESSVYSEDVEVESKGGKSCGCFGFNSRADNEEAIATLRNSYSNDLLSESQGSDNDDNDDGVKNARSSSTVDYKKTSEVHETDATDESDGEMNIEASTTSRKTTRFCFCGGKPTDDTEIDLQNIDNDEERDRVATISNNLKSAESRLLNDDGEHVETTADDADDAGAITSQTSIIKTSKKSWFACCKSKDVDNDEVEIEKLASIAKENGSDEVEQVKVKRSCFCCKTKITEHEEVTIQVDQPTSGANGNSPGSSVKVVEPTQAIPAPVYKFSPDDVKRMVHADEPSPEEREEKVKAESELQQAFDNAQGVMNEEQKYEYFTKTFPEATEEDRRRWSTTVGCYLTHDPNTRQFEMIWSERPLNKALAFFTCSPDILPQNKIKLNERTNITDKGIYSNVARAAFNTFVKYAARYDGEFSFLTNDIWKTANFGEIQIVVLQSDGTVIILKRGCKPYLFYNPQAFAIVENSFRYLPKRRGVVPKWSLNNFATTTKSLSQAMYSEFSSKQRIRVQLKFE